MPSPLALAHVQAVLFQAGAESTVGSGCRLYHLQLDAPAPDPNDASRPQSGCRPPDITVAAGVGEALRRLQGRSCDWLSVHGAQLRARARAQLMLFYKESALRRTSQSASGSPPSGVPQST